MESIEPTAPPSLDETAPVEGAQVAPPLAPTSDVVAVPVAEPDAGDLGEEESLRGAVMVMPDAREADALRDALDLDRVRSTAVQSTINAGDLETITDPTDQYEVHDAAVGGDPIARAIEVARAESERPAPDSRSAQLAGSVNASQQGFIRPPARKDRDTEPPEVERPERVVETSPTRREGQAPDQ